MWLANTSTEILRLVMTQPTLNRCLDRSGIQVIIFSFQAEDDRTKTDANSDMFVQTTQLQMVLFTS